MPEFSTIPGTNLTVLAAAIPVAISENFTTDDIRTLAVFFNALSSDLSTIAVQDEIQTNTQLITPEPA